MLNPSSQDVSLPRKIVEEATFDEQRAALKITCRIFDEAFEKVDLALARLPELFPVVPGRELRRLRLNGYSRMPDINIWFTFTDTTVTLHFIEKADGEE